MRPGADMQGTKPFICRFDLRTVVVCLHSFLLDKQLRDEWRTVPALVVLDNNRWGASASPALVRCLALASDGRRQVSFLAAGDPAFALPCELLPGECWWGATAIVPSQVRPLAKHSAEPFLECSLRTQHVAAMR